MSDGIQEEAVPLKPIPNGGPNILKHLFGDPAIELASRRTGMSFQRTRVSVERTLMSVIRTSLSLIAFGFTIFQFFRYLRDSAAAFPHVPVAAAHNFGFALVLLGVGMLVLGMWYHVKFMLGLRAERALLVEQRLIYGESHFPISLTLVVAAILLMIGLLAIASMVIP